MGVRDFAVVPFFAGVGGVVLMAGTVFGQSGHDTFDTADNFMSDIGGMKMGGGDGGNALSGSMPGMNMGRSSSAGSSSSSMSSSMPGVSSGSGPAPGGGTMTMPDGSRMSSAAMPDKSVPMNMSDPKMAASMPGGVHSTCTGDVCTVIFAPSGTGVARILGTTAKLDSAKAGQVVLTIGKKHLTLRQGKPVSEGKLRIELRSSNAGGYTVEFTKPH